MVCVNFDMCGYFGSAPNYLKYYGLDFEYESFEHNFFTFQSDGQVLAGHTFKPKEYKGTVVVLHGFFGHCGLLKHLIKYLIEQSYAVACYDMQGHGLSTGELAGIEDFSRYSYALRDFVNVVQPQLKGPYHLIGHSLGGAAVLDYLLTYKDNVFENIVLAAPLVRCSLWKLSRIGFRLYRPFGKRVPRVFRNNSSDREFLKFVRKKDKLCVRAVPLKWIEALYEWNDRIVGCGLCDRTVKVIQGTDDTTVAWRFNIKFIRERFGNVDISLIENARHELFNESAGIRMQVFSQISGYLDEK